MHPATARLAFIGAGNMSSSLIGGLLEQGYPASQIIATDPSPQQRDAVANRFGIEVSADNVAAVATAEVVLLAVKPQVLKAVALELAPALGHRPLLLSIAAGIGLESLASWLGPQLPLVRCMPNTPALVRSGAAALCGNRQVSAAQRELSLGLLEAMGTALWLEDESLLDAVTAISGSGPAYFFLLIEALQMAAVELGLPAETARQLTLQTALGAARMALAEPISAAELRRRVTSPGGTTERAIQVFEAGGFTALVRQAALAAAQRSAELATELGEPATR
ncbi:MAG TPA: pyrroline-5-carboxylate reductase [Pseudomonadales bacterium]|jgi:pyrroline-5-carboxylate reductase|nr:pyrroline-5-carboxylate reductase [Pseudomonadales bacterium]HMW83279.1 pyrroline-5-carboxylate reductase [Pseudomonadales bacterium]HMZ70796.1 pyrroline-5-carboxylate reductase [Pseudomonadales bacterium]HNC76680.1 pyrroline-5-carboxylate reductase [Pseudomonadales bacterium]HNL23795.1 pyrroline-5-carboxylate reductase [Pseudomonadales bacterium]